MISLGIDIGLSGALAVVRGDQLLGLEDMPTREKPGTGLIKREVDPVALRAMVLRLCEGRRDEAIAVSLEHVFGIGPSAGGQKNHGASGAFSLGETRGAVRAVLEVLGLQPAWISPLSWKRHYDLLGRKGEKVDKNASRLKALALYPTADLQRVKDHNRAEAILLARFGWERNS